MKTLDNYTLEVVARYLRLRAYHDIRITRSFESSLYEQMTASRLRDIARWLERHARGEKPIQYDFRKGVKGKYLKRWKDLRNRWEKGYIDETGYYHEDRCECAGCMNELEAARKREGK